MPWPRSSSRIQPATLSRKYRWWVIATTVPGYSLRKRSSQATDSASRWLVGSSSSRRSGCRRRSRQRATRAFPPPERAETRAGGVAALLAARERRDVGVGRRQPERVHRDLERAVELPGVARVDAVLE